LKFSQLLLFLKEKIEILVPEQKQYFKKIFQLKKVNNGKR